MIPKLLWGRWRWSLHEKCNSVSISTFTSWSTPIYWLPYISCIFHEHTPKKFFQYQTGHLAQCRQTSCPWQLPNPDWSIGFARQRITICCSRECISTALKSTGEWSAPSCPTLCIAPGDVRLGGSCSAMETCSLKFSTPCLWATLWKPDEVWRPVAPDSAECSPPLCTFGLSLWWPCDEFTWISSLRVPIVSNGFNHRQWIADYSEKIPRLYHTGIPELMSNPKISHQWENSMIWMHDQTFFWLFIQYPKKDNLPGEFYWFQHHQISSYFYFLWGRKDRVKAFQP